MSNSLISSLGIGGKYQLDSDLNVCLHSDGGAFLGDTGQIVYKEELVDTSFNGISWNKVLGYDINLEALFLPLSDKFNVVLVDSIIEDWGNYEKAVFTILEPDYTKSTDTKIVLKKVVTSILGQSASSQLFCAYPGDYRYTLLSSFVNDSNKSEDDLIPTIFIWLTKRSLELTAAKLMGEVTVDYIKTSGNGYKGLFDSDAFYTSYGFKSNTTTFLSIMQYMSTTGLSTKLVNASDSSKPAVYSSTDGTTDKLANLPTTIKKLEASNVLKNPTTEFNITLQDINSELLTIPDLYSRSYIFSYVYSASITGSFRNRYFAGSANLKTVLNKSKQTLHKYKNITIFSSYSKLSHTHASYELDIHSILNPYTVKSIEVSLYEGSNIVDTSSVDGNVVPLCDATKLKEVFFSKYEEEYDEFNNLSKLYIATNSYSNSDKDRYIIINWICR